MAASTVRPVLLLAGGSFNPPTHMHLRLFELAKDHLTKKGIPVLGGIISPVNDAYEKKSLAQANATHRVKMAELAVANYDFVKCSTWEVDQSKWTRTRAVLDEYNKLITEAVQDQTKPQAPWLPDNIATLTSGVVPRVLFICGGDLLESFSVPGLWLEEDINVIARDYGLVVISREGTDPKKYVYEHDTLDKYQDNIHFVTERFPNDISSTKVRRAVRRGDSIRFLVPDAVIDYIRKTNLYKDSDDDSKRDTNEYITTANHDLISMQSYVKHENDVVDTKISACQTPMKQNDQAEEQFAMIDAGQNGDDGNIEEEDDEFSDETPDDRDHESVLGKCMIAEDDQPLPPPPLETETANAPPPPLAVYVPTKENDDANNFNPALDKVETSGSKSDNATMTTTSTSPTVKNYNSSACSPKSPETATAVASSPLLDSKMSVPCRDNSIAATSVCPAVVDHDGDDATAEQRPASCADKKSPRVEPVVSNPEPEQPDQVIKDDTEVEVDKILLTSAKKDKENIATMASNLKSPSPVHFQITPKGVRVISDRESFL